MISRCEDDPVPLPIDQADTDVCFSTKTAFRQKIPTIQTNERRIKTFLRLPSNILQGPGEQDDHAISSICGLTNQSCIGRCLAGLDVTDNQAASLPRSGLNRITHHVE